MDTLNIILSLFNFVILVMFLAYWLVLQSRENNKSNNLKKVRSKVDKILEKAYEKSDQIVTDAKKVSKKLQEQTDDNFKKTVSQISSENEKYYKKATSELEISIRRFVDKLEKKEDTKLVEYGEKINQQMAKNVGAIQDQINNIAESFTKDLEAFKLSEKERVKSNISERIEDIIKELLPVNITIEDHETLVEQAINKAEKEGLFK